MENTLKEFGRYRLKEKLMKILLVLAILVITVWSDQATKGIAKEKLQNQPVVQVVDSLFILTYAENDGAFLSLGKNWPAPVKTLVFISLPLLALVWLGWLIVKSKSRSPLGVIALSLFIGGGIGNLIDRLMNHGVVIDFMNFGIGQLRTGVLNVADLYLTVGAIMLCFVSFDEKPKKKKEA